MHPVIVVQKREYWILYRTVVCIILGIISLPKYESSMAYIHKNTMFKLKGFIDEAGAINITIHI